MFTGNFKGKGFQQQSWVGNVSRFCVVIEQEERLCEAVYVWGKGRGKRSCTCVCYAILGKKRENTFSKLEGGGGLYAGKRRIS